MVAPHYCTVLSQILVLMEDMHAVFAAGQFTLTAVFPYLSGKMMTGYSRLNAPMHVTVAS